MKSERIKSHLLSALTIAVSIIFIQSCTKTPTPAFSYQPSVNPEAGDSIAFINESMDASNFIWDFGDNYSSSERNPYNIYVEAGTYNVTLTANNDKKSAMITQSITINEPTGLALFVTEDDEETAISDVVVWLYDNEEDFNNYNYQYEAITDSDGFALFLNIDARKYWVDLYKDVAGGYWESYWTVGPLTINEVGIYLLPMNYLPDATKSLKGKMDVRPAPLSARKVKK